MFDEFRHRAGAGGGARKPGWAAAQSARVSQRTGGDRTIEAPEPAQVLVLGGNDSTLAIVNAMIPTDGTIAARLIPLAWTPIGTAVGETAQVVHVPFEGLLDWIDRTFPPEDEHSFGASGRDLELLARIGWNAPLPDLVGVANVLNVEDLPDDIVAALAHPPETLVQCAACRRLCVRDDFVWKEKQLCAWDFHAQVFGKRGPWHEGVYEDRHFETLPACAYVVVGLLAELGVEPILRLGALPENVERELVNNVLLAEPGRPHMAVRTDGGFTVLREA